MLSSTEEWPSITVAVDRHLFARAHAQAVADLDIFERDFLLAAVLADHPRGLGRKVEQRADRLAGAFARAQLHHLPEQDQHDDHCRRLEIDRDMARARRESPPGRSPAREPRRR